MKNFTVRETAKIDGGAYRWVEFPDGSARVEEWRGGKWVPGGATFWEFFDTPPVGAAFAAELGIPPSDLALATAPPSRRNSSKLSEADLRQAIRLGTQMAEALAMLTTKTQQLAEDRRRPRRVVENNPPKWGVLFPAYLNTASKSVKTEGGAGPSRPKTNE